MHNSLRIVLPKLGKLALVITYQKRIFVYQKSIMIIITNSTTKKAFFY